MGVALGDVGVACGDEWNIKSLTDPRLEKQMWVWFGMWMCLVEMERQTLTAPLNPSFIPAWLSFTVSVYTSDDDDTRPQDIGG